MLKRRGVIAGAAGLAIVPASAVRAQAWPSGPVKIVVPYIPGGATDTAGRLLAEKMTGLLGQQVIVENKGGGNTIIGMELVAKSKPDGNTLLLGTTTLATNAALGLKQPYDPLKDFQPISTIVDIPDMIAINKDHPAKDYKAFVEWMNKQPEKVRFATSGLGNQPHLWGELFKTRNKLNMEFVAYKGAADALRDVMGGHVPMIIDVVMPMGQHATQGRLTGLVVSAEKRSPVCPDVPTVVELGMPDMVGAVYFGLVAPAGVPRPIVDRLNGMVRQIIKDPAVEKKFLEMGYVTTGCTPEEYSAKLKFETERWTKVVKENNIKVES
jgi:tripartite-type tricarboxylate transporter receptor subunit TctC